MTIKEFYVSATHDYANTGRQFSTEGTAVAWAEQMRAAGWTVTIRISGYVEGYEHPGKAPVRWTDAAAPAPFWCGQHAPCETQCSLCAFEHPA